MNKIASHAIALVAGGAIVAAGCAWLKLRPSLPSVLAPPAPELAREQTRTLDCKPVIVYRDKVEKKLDLPAAVRRDPDKHVVAASKVPASDHPHTMTAVYDERTGGVDMYLRRDPLPWLGFDARKELGIAYGLKRDADAAVARLHGKLDLVQIKALRGGLLGTIDSDGDWFAGVGVSLRF